MSEISGDLLWSGQYSGKWEVLVTASLVLVDTNKIVSQCLIWDSMVSKRSIR